MMSAGNAINELIAVLTATSSPDNATRSNAEMRLNNEWVTKRPDDLLLGLAQLLQQHEDPGVRTINVGVVCTYQDC